MKSFDPTEEQRMMRDTVADFAREKLRERSREIEGARKLPDDLRRAIAELGITTLTIPESCGGAGMPALTAALVEEELAWGDAAVPFAMPGPGTLGHALLELANDEQQKRLFEPFVSDPSRYGAVAWSESRPHAQRAGFNAVAKREGSSWIVDGTKSYVLNAGIASSYVVFAQTDESKGWDGVGAFVVDGAKVKVGQRYTTLGLDAATFGEVTFEQAAAEPLLGRGDFPRALRRFFARLSLSVAARAVGLGRAAWEVSRSYADERKAFGKPIGHFQSIAFLLADRHIDVEGARGLVWRAAWTLDKNGDDTEARCAEACAEALEVVQQTGADAVQIHGGAGFVRDYIVEKYMRDGKQMALCAPSVTTNDQLFAALTLLGSGAALDPALVLPVPDVQPIFT